MFEYYAVGAGLRFAQIVIYSTLWIVVGCFVAAFFRRILGPERTRQFFGNGSIKGLIIGWAMGMLIPVCSLGVIPIVRELHRSKVQGGTIIAFGLTAPLFNPLSVLYGLTLSDPIAIVTFSFCSLLIVTGLGFLWDKVINKPEEESDFSEEGVAYGIKRMTSVLDTCSRELIGPSLVFILIGMLGSAVVASLLPHGYLLTGLEQTNAFAPVKVAAIATPIYSTPLLAMSQIGGMFQHGNSVGAAFSLLILGAGVNIGLLCCFANLFGWKRLLLFLSILVGVTLVLAYAISGPLYPEGVEPAGHSHAFDVYSQPFQKNQANLVQVARMKIADFWKTNETGGSFIFVFLVVAGLVFRVINRFTDLESWYRSEDKTTSSYDTILPGWVLSLSMILILLGVSVASCFVYYPAPKEVLADMDFFHAECVVSSRTKKWEQAEKWIQICDDLSRRLEIGIYLRQGEVDEFHSTTTQLYRETLDELRHSVEAKDPSRIREQTTEVRQAFVRMKKAFKKKYVEPTAQ